jgi:uncharacterized protein YbaP (TraB family)
LFEIKFDAAAISKTLEMMYYQPSSGKNLKSVVGSDLYSSFMKMVPKKDPANEKLKPWSAAIMLQYPKDTGDGIDLDMRLQQFAASKAVNIVGLEKVEEQLSIFDSQPQDEQIQMLKDVLDNYDDNLVMQKKLEDAYLASDLKTMEKLIPETIALSDDKEKAKEMLKLLIDDRNLRMSGRAQRYLEQGGAFIAIGALHLPGEKGVLKLLEDKGFRIEVFY